MAASGILKNLNDGLSSVFDESVVYRGKNGQFTSQKQSEKGSSGTKVVEKGRKRIFQERKSAAPHHGKHHDYWQTFLNNSKEKREMHENSFWSRIKGNGQVHYANLAIKENIFDKQTKYLQKL